MLVNWLHRHPRFVDWVLFAAALASTGIAAANHHRPAIGVPLAVAACLPLLVRRRYPLAVLAVTVAATAAILAVWHRSEFLPAGIALFTVASSCGRRVSLRAGALAVLVLALPYGGATGWWRHDVQRLLGFAIAWLAGDSVGTRRRELDALEERAERLERERAAEAARAVAEEQARIARELHDVVAHNVSVMVVQAAAANDVFDARPERAREALREIERTGRAALGELRALLGVVRGEEAALAPQPGVDRIDALVAQVRAAGLDVALSIEGPPRPLPAGVDLSAYRVVQEALTNTLKHAQATRADVAVRYRDDELGVEVRDDGVGAGAAGGEGAGRGLVGMRERVGAFGGSLTAAPAPGGGFAVSARFPLGAQS